MATPHATASSSEEPVSSSPYGLIADKLYDYCREHLDADDVLLQTDLLKPEIIPNKELDLLVAVCQHLVDQHLFKIHDTRANGIGWKLLTRENAALHVGLTRDEELVFSHIESKGSQGVWQRSIKENVSMHGKVVDRCLKTLESKGRIDRLQDVKNLARKTYIVKGLKPAEGVTGGAWYTDGHLDQTMISTVADFIEITVGERSWVEAKPSPKRKEPQGGFNEGGEGKQKMRKKSADQPIVFADHSLTDHSPTNHSANPPVKHRSLATKAYTPHPSDYKGYHTLATITKAINGKKLLSKGLLPQNSISELITVMIYDDKLVTIPDLTDPFDTTKTMYRTVKTPSQIIASVRLRQRLEGGVDISDLTRRELDLEDIGHGGATEVPCLRCPQFHFCEDGGPVNVRTCVYFEPWFQKIEAVNSIEVEIT